jgi:hypothetical protein
MYAVQRVEPTNQDASRFLDHLQRQHSYALGFLTHVAIAEAIARGRVLRAYENGDPAGYMIHGSIKPNTRILQICVANDARRIQHATAMIEALKVICSGPMVEMLSCHCAEDLDSNAFWQSLGFAKTGQRLKSKTGRRWQNRYELPLPGAVLKTMMAASSRQKSKTEGLFRLLTKGDARIAGLSFTRKKLARHSLLLPEVDP